MKKRNVIPPDGGEDCDEVLSGRPHIRPPGETHTPIVPDDVKEMATLLHVTGGYTHVDPHGDALEYEDVFTKLEDATRHYQAAGLGN